MRTFIKPSRKKQVYPQDRAPIKNSTTQSQSNAVKTALVSVLVRPSNLFMKTDELASSSGQHAEVHLLLQGKGHSLEKSNVHILDREVR